MVLHSHHEWYISNTRKIDYALVLITRDALGERFLRGPWVRFLDEIGTDERFQLFHYTEEDLDDLPLELASRWYREDWPEPFIALFTHQSWQEGILDGWVFHGKVDNHWSLDRVVEFESSGRFDYPELVAWYRSIVVDPHQQTIKHKTNTSYFE